MTTRTASDIVMRESGPWFSEAAIGVSFGAQAVGGGVSSRLVRHSSMAEGIAHSGRDHPVERLFLSNEDLLR